jgi:hypothetical protein
MVLFTAIVSALDARIPSNHLAQKRHEGFDEHIRAIIPGISAKALIPEGKGLVQRNHFRQERQFSG